jgi:hypothetical protein
MPNTPPPILKERKIKGRRFLLAAPNTVDAKENAAASA